MRVLDGINAAADVRKLNIDQLKALSSEIRQEILDVTLENGGHLASNLGIVETTVALYKTFDFSKDKLIFDVGHQCYAHKILSGRKETFSTIRKDGGLSGFPNPKESEYDAFISGHAGTSISAGIGYCAARDNKKENYTVISVVGDASFTNGLNLEALTVKGSKPKNFIVLLNDNGMSISKNVNGLYQFISKKTTKRSYIGAKRKLKRVFGNTFITKGLIGIRNFIKRLTGGHNIFEELGFKYVGVVDGDDVNELTKMLARVKLLAKDEAVLLHVKTTKGKGFTDAEKHADVYHGVGASYKNEVGEFASALGDKLNGLISGDKKIVAITAGMKDGTGLFKVEEEHKENFVDVGIAEEYAVTVAAGMAAGGLKPFVCVYSTFLQRAYDEIIHDVCLQNLPVTFCMDRSGLVGSDGCTHQGVFDLSYLLHVPNLEVFAPSCTDELVDILDYAAKHNSPIAIRYPKNACGKRNAIPLKDGRWEVLKPLSDINIIAVGPTPLSLALEASEKVGGVGVINARTVKPVCKATLDAIRGSLIITIEENSVIGGFGSYVLSYYAKTGGGEKVLNLGVGDEFVEHGSIANQLKSNGLTAENLIETIEKLKK